MGVILQNKNFWQKKTLYQRLLTGLGTRFAVLMSAVLIWALLLVSLLNLHNQQIQIHETLREKGQLLGHFVAMISPEAIYSYDFTMLNKFTKEISLHKDIIYSLVVDMRGWPLASFVDRSNPLIQSLKLQDSSNTIKSIASNLRLREDVIHLIFPIISDGESLGEIWVGISTQRSNELLKATALEQFWINLLFIIGINIGVFIIFHFKVLQPVHKLMNAADRLRKGRFDTFININSKNEFGTLADSFNFMMKNLQQNIHKLNENVTEKQQALLEASEQNWLNEGLHCFVEAIHGNLDLKQLGEHSIQNLSEQLKIEQINLYLKVGSDLQTLACLSLELNKQAYIAIEEQSLLKELNQTHHAILYTNTNLLNQSQTQAYLYYVPIVLQNQFTALLELGFQHKPKHIELDLIQRCAKHLAISIYAIQQQQQTQQALEITQEKTHLLEQKGEQLRFAMEETERATKAKSTFLANMSHELRTPLNAILGFSEMILEDLQDQGGNQEMIGDMAKIHHAGETLLSLVNDVLDISKIESGKMDIYIEPIDLKKLLQGLIDTITPLAHKNNCQLELIQDPRLGEFYADFTKVKQILLNLLSNAIKFGENGKISLSAHYLQSENIYEFRVQDQGIGISQSQIEKLFQSFTQADPSTTRKYGGTGLGLTICKQFTEIMGGKIWVESQLQHGSCFIIQIPVQVQHNIKPLNLRHSKQATLAKLDISPIKEHGVVLIVDDDHEIRKLLSEHLEKLGYRPITAASGKEALSIIHKVQPDAITLDVMMPEMDGWELLSQIKADAALMHIPVIMVSIIEDKSKGYALGATDYIVKPVRREQLAAILNKYKTNSQSQILLIEDDPITCNMMTQLLKKIDCQVIIAENGKIALTQLEKHKPHVILLDLMMPEMDGFEFAHTVRQHPEWHHIPIVILTAKDLTPEEHLKLSNYSQAIYQKGNYQQTDLLAQIQSHFIN